MTTRTTIARVLTGLLFVAATATTAGAQVAIKHQPADPGAWYRAAVAARNAGRPDEKTLLALRAGVSPIDPSLRDDLTSKDWLSVGSWSYPEKTLGVWYLRDEPCQLDVQRVLADGGTLNFSYSAACADREHGAIVHTNFANPSPVKTGLRTIGRELYLEIIAYGASELHRVVSYSKGVLVVDISYDGKPRSKRVKFRSVQIAIPRGFDYTLGE